MLQRREPADGSQEASAPPSGKLVGWLKEIAMIVVIALVLSFLIKTFLFRAFFIPSGSMEHTLEINDKVFVNLNGPAWSGLHRGDIVVFKDTQRWLRDEPRRIQNHTPLAQGLQFVGLLPDTSDEYLIKRVIGLPGDHVRCCDSEGRISINGKSVDEPYAVKTDPALFKDFDVVVPPEKIWVLGDNRPNSSDSRAHQTLPSKGFVNEPDVIGTAVVLAWPLNRFALLGSDKADY